jgi:hypothetical protein
MMERTKSAKQTVNIINCEEEVDDSEKCTNQSSSQKELRDFELRVKKRVKNMNDIT